MTEQTPAAGALLLPCPFCGSESVSQDSTACTDAADYIWFKCDGCGVESEGEHGRDAALAQWNRRPHAPVSRPGDGVEGESVAIMRPFWVSWWGEPGTFELHRPWWVSGERDDGKKSICAAVLAQDEFTARLSVQWAHDDNDAVIEWRFAEEKPKGWSPFGSRFPQADWMIWPEMAALTPPAEPVSRPAGEGEREAGDYTMALAERQAFEGHTDLAAHIERMATTGRIGSMIEWDGFLRSLNAALLSPAAPDAGGGEELKADFVRAHPSGFDDCTYEQIEDALDRADAPITGPDGKFLTLAQRVAALQPGGER